MSNGRVAYTAFFQATQEACGHKTYVSFEDLSLNEQAIWAHVENQVVAHQAYVEYGGGDPTVMQRAKMVDEVERQARLQEGIDEVEASGRPRQDARRYL